MWRRHGSNFNMDSEAYDIARGLYDSKGKKHHFVRVEIFQYHGHCEERSKWSDFLD